MAPAKEKRKGEKEQERSKQLKRRENTLSFYNGYFGDSFWPKKTV